MHNIVLSFLEAVASLLHTDVVCVITVGLFAAVTLGVGIVVFFGHVYLSFTRRIRTVRYAKLCLTPKTEGRQCTPFVVPDVGPSYVRTDGVIKVPKWD